MNFLAGVKIYLAMQTRPDTEPSKFIYISVLNMKADSKDTMTKVINDLARIFGVGTRIKYLISLLVML